MPNLKKRTVPREAWAMLSAERLKFSNELLWLIDRSLDCVEGAFNGRDLINEGPPMPDQEELRKIAMARAFEEGSLSVAPDAAERTRAGVFEDELRCLLKTLQRHVATLTDESRVAFQLSRKSHRGRPIKGRRSNDDMLQAFLPPPGWAGLPRMRGRKRAFPVSSDALLRVVEEGRRAGHRTERESLDALVREKLAVQGKHTAGGRVPHLVKNLQRRLSEYRALLKRQGNSIE